MVYGLSQLVFLVVCICVFMVWMVLISDVGCILLIGSSVIVCVCLVSVCRTLRRMLLVFLVMLNVVVILMMVSCVSAQWLRVLMRSCFILLMCVFCSVIFFLVLRRCVCVVVSLVISYVFFCFSRFMLLVFMMIFLL